MKEKVPVKTGKQLRLIDIIMLVLCLSGAAGSFAMFWFGLFAQNNSGSEKSAGFITRKNNVVQRRPADRVLWGRLALDSPVYLGDLILVAESSSATLNVDGNFISLNENTLIRIQRGAGDKKRTKVDLEESFIEISLDEGSLDLIAGVQGNIPLINVGNSKVMAQSGTVLSVEARKDGEIEVQVIEGAAVMSAGKEKNTDFTPAKSAPKELLAGTMVTIDAEGTERLVPGVMVMRPRPNAHYLKNRPEAFSLDFAWNRINLEPEKTLRLEIATDQNFNRIAFSVDGLHDTAKAALNAGQWYWRLCLDTTVLATGQLTVTEATGPELISPPKETIVRYREELPLLRFQWSERKEAMSYFLEVARTPDFSNARINPVDSVFFVDSSLEPGIWYWRVIPVFPKIYEGSAAYSSVSIFHIEQQLSMAETQVIEPPATMPAVQEPEPESVAQEPEAEPVPVEEAPQSAVPAAFAEVRLLAPANGTSLTGLTALRNQTIFSWEYKGQAARSRFVLSRNSNPLQGRSQVERTNPGSTVSLNRLEEGDWYWTVEIVTPEGRVIRADKARHLRVLPIPILPVPGNRRPSNGHRIGKEELEAQRNITFSWSAVQGANAYIVTLYQETDGRRRKITGTDQPVSRTSWTLTNLSVLDRGSFIWQVEAVNTAGGRIDQRGRLGENTFSIDIPRPDQMVHSEEPSILE
jgi:hypothetical protein